MDQFERFQSEPPELGTVNVIQYWAARQNDPSWANLAKMALDLLAIQRPQLAKPFFAMRITPQTMSRKDVKIIIYQHSRATMWQLQPQCQPVGNGHGTKRGQRSQDQTWAAVKIR